MLKNICASCAGPNSITQEHYEMYGNYCGECVTRINGVFYTPVIRKKVDYAKDRMVDFKEVLERIALEHDVTAAEILGKRRTKKISMAKRQVIVALVDGGWNYMDTARIMGYNDHTTVLYHYNMAVVGTRFL